MKLRFYANADALVYIPGSRAGIGQPAHYIGRRYQAPKDGKPASYPATEEPYEVELDRTRLVDEQIFLRYMKLTRRGDILPADEATAKECGAEYRAATFKDDEWTQPPKPPEAPPPTLVGSEPSVVTSAPADAAFPPPPATYKPLVDKRHPRKESE